MDKYRNLQKSKMAKKSKLIKANFTTNKLFEQHIHNEEILEEK